MGGVKTISIIVAANIKGLEAGLGKANKSIAGFASNAARIGSALTFGITAPLTALGKSAFDTFSNFENAMMKVNTVTGASADEFKMLTEEARRLGATTQFTASQVADLQLVLGRKGFDPTAIQNMEGSILDLALATGEDLSLAADTVASSINAFGLETDQSGRVANTLASAAANSSIQLGTFATAFGHAGASANAVGVDIEELSAMMGVLMDNGIKASKAGTGLRKVFMKLSEEGIPFDATLNNLSSGNMSLAEAQNLVGTTAANQLLILSQNRDKISELTEEYDTNTDRLDKMAEAMGSTTFAKVKKMQSAIEGLKIELGALLADAIMPLIEFITSLAQKFGELDIVTQKIIIGIGAFLAVLGPLALLIGGLGGAFVAGLTAMAPFLIALAKFVLIAAAIVIAVDKIILILGTLFTALNDNAQAITDRFVNIARTVANFFIDMFEGTVKFLKDTAKRFGITIFEDFKPSQKFELIPDDEIAKFTSLKSSFDSFSDKYSSFKKNVGDSVKGIFSFGDSSKPGVTSPKKDPETRTLEEAYDAIFGPGAYAAYKEDIRLKEEQIASTQRWRNSLTDLAVGVADSFSSSFAEVILSGQGFLKSMKQVFIDLAKQIAATIVKALVLKAILSVTGLGATSAGKEAFGADQSFKGLLGGMLGGTFANGGTPPIGKISLVGEKGPELFVPNQAGTIIPNGGFSQNITVTGMLSSEGIQIATIQGQEAASQKGADLIGGSFRNTPF